MTRQQTFELLADLALSGSDRELRRGAVSALAAISLHAGPGLDEGLATLLVTLAFRVTEDAIQVRTLVRILIAETRDPEKLIPALRRLAAACLERRHFGALAEGLYAMLADCRYDGAVYEAWLSKCFDGLIDPADPLLRAAAALLEVAMERSAVVPEWATVAVSQWPEIHFSRRLSMPVAIRLHVAAPTSLGWLALGLVHRGDSGPWTRERFGERADDAVAALAAAFRSARTGAPEPRRLCLQRFEIWMRTMTTGLPATAS